MARNPLIRMTKLIICPAAGAGYFQKIIAGGFLSMAANATAG